MNQENKRQPVYFLHSGIPHLFRFTPTLCTDEWNVFMYTWKWELRHPAVIAYGSIEEWEHDTNQPVVAILKEQRVVIDLQKSITRQNHTMNHENKRQPVYFLLNNDKELHRIDNGQVQYLSKMFGWIDMHYNTKQFTSIEQWGDYSGRKVVATLKIKKNDGNKV